MQTYNFSIRDKDGVKRTVTIKAKNYERAQIKLIIKYNPMVIYNNHW